MRSRRIKVCDITDSVQLVASVAQASCTGYACTTNDARGPCLCFAGFKRRTNYPKPVTPETPLQWVALNGGRARHLGRRLHDARRRGMTLLDDSPRLYTLARRPIDQFSRNRRAHEGWAMGFRRGIRCSQGLVGPAPERLLPSCCATKLNAHGPLGAGPCFVPVRSARRA